MTRTFGIVASAVLAAAVALGAACGGDDKGGATTTTPVAETSASPQARRTPFATPQINGNQLDSAKGYTVTYPAGWKVRANFLNTADATVDAFFEPLEGPAVAGQVQANISVMCVLDKAPDSKQYAPAVQTLTARLPNNSSFEISERKISGTTAVVQAYHTESKTDPAQPKLDQRDYLFTNDKCDWRITTTAPAGQLDKYKPAFDGFLDSFKLK